MPKVERPFRLLFSAQARHNDPSNGGRPRQREWPGQKEMDSLQQEVTSLKAMLQAAQIREELAVLIPQVTRPAKAASKRFSPTRGIACGNAQQSGPSRPPLHKP